MWTSVSNVLTCSAHAREEKLRARARARMARSSLDQTLSCSSRSNILPEFYAMFALEHRGSALKEHARAQKDTRALASLPPPRRPRPRRRGAH